LFFLYFISACQTIINLKFFLVVVDTGNVFMVYLLSKKSWKKTLLYGLNPITILVTSLHGQFDVLPIFFMLVAVYFARTTGMLSYFFFSCAVGIKTWPVLFVAPFLRRVRPFYGALLIPVVVVIISFAYSFFFHASI
ncbi:MAG: DUF2029 domain-containing protein, partial [Flavobacteriales bacterium]|nr:DUF2029 domain-containing protein [Flavobacteriales bacterium]